MDPQTRTFLLTFGFKIILLGLAIWEWRRTRASLKRDAERDQ
jgi:hypothetical protein